jgi:hypothetical protein
MRLVLDASPPGRLCCSISSAGRRPVTAFGLTRLPPNHLPALKSIGRRPSRQSNKPQRSSTPQLDSTSRVLVWVSTVSDWLLRTCVCCAAGWLLQEPSQVARWLLAGKCVSLDGCRAIGWPFSCWRNGGCKPVELEMKFARRNSSVPNSLAQARAATYLNHLLERCLHGLLHEANRLGDDSKLPSSTYLYFVNPYELAQ